MKIYNNLNNVFFISVFLTILYFLERRRNHSSILLQKNQNVIKRRFSRQKINISKPEIIQTSFRFSIINPLIITYRETKNNQRSGLAMSYERRKQKFSQESINKIRENHLRDSALLSRSDNNSALEKLLSDQSERNKLLNEIKETDSKNLKEHGLRKLREIIVSKFEEYKDNSEFNKFVKETYRLSYDLFLKEGRFNQIGGIIFTFLTDKLPETAYELGFLQLYIIYLSHHERDSLKAIHVLQIHKNIFTKEEFHHLLQMCIIFCHEIQPPNKWFQLLEHYKGNKIIWEFLYKTKIISQVQQRCLDICQKSYNQLSLMVFKEMWLQNIPLETEIENSARNSFLFETLSNGSEMIYFKKRPVT